MDTAFISPARSSVSWWHDTLAPKEHGSWSLAFEPIVLSCLVAPSVAGGYLSVALAAGFFARRPLKIAFRDQRPERRTAAMWALMGCAGVALFALAAAIALAGIDWLVWLCPAAIAGIIFACFDCHGSGREETAEVVGAAAFATVPAAFAALAGWPLLSGVALALVMLGRSVPSVLCVRAFIRAAKTGVHRNTLALVTTLLAFATVAGLANRGLVPFFAVIAMAVFVLRAYALLVFVRPAWRARRVGMIEANLGIVFLIGLAVAWAA
jgi:hypothetical protein